MANAKSPSKARERSTGMPASARSRRARFTLLGAVILSAAILAAWFPAVDLLHQRSSLASASAQLHQLHSQDAALAQERRNLSDAAEISRLAREQYQLVSPGQQPYEVLPPSGTSGGGSSLYPGDPGAQGPVAPSASVELPPGVSTTTPTHGSSGASAQGGATSQPSTLTRMLHALEFWR